MFREFLLITMLCLYLVSASPTTKKDLGDEKKTPEQSDEATNDVGGGVFRRLLEGADEQEIVGKVKRALKDHVC